MNVNVGHVKANQHFCNKIWQAFRFFLMNIDKGFKPADDLHEVPVVCLCICWLLQNVLV